MNQWKDIPSIGSVLAGNLEKAGVAGPAQLRELGGQRRRSCAYAPR